WGTDGSKRSEITAEQAKDQIATANTYLKELTGEDPVLMAYPYGSYNENAIKVNEENGIQYAFKAGMPDEEAYTMGRHYITEQDVTEIAQLIGGPVPETEPTPNPEEGNDENVVYHETFENGLGIVTPAGNAQVNQISDVVFEGNDDGNAVFISERTNNYDGIDINFNKVGMENCITYGITVKGYLDEDVSVPEGSQALLQNIDSYEGLYLQADYAPGESFTLEGEYTVNTENDKALRIQSNDNGASVPFYVGDILITEIATSEDEETDEEEEIDEERPAAEEFTTISFENQELNGFEALGETETLTVTDEANHTEDGAYAL